MLAPIAYLGPTQVARWRDVQRQAADKELRFAAESIARAIGGALEVSVRELTAMANQIGAHGYYDAEFLRTLLHEHCSAFPSCLGVFVSRPDGYPITGDPVHPVMGGVGDREYFQESCARSEPRSLVSRSVGSPGCRRFRCAPIWASPGANSREVQGAVVGGDRARRLPELTTNSVEVFGDMQARALDKRSRVVVDSNPRWQPAFTDLSAIEMYAGVPPGQALLATATTIKAKRCERPWRAWPTRGSVGQSPSCGRRGRLKSRRVAPSQHVDCRVRRTALGCDVRLCVVVVVGPADQQARTLHASGCGRRGRISASSARWDAREVTDLLATVGSMVAQLRHQADALREREKEQVGRALSPELEIAERIQVGILPKCFYVPGFEIAAQMRPAEAVGGDYYELLPTQSGFWIAAGDVSGHGLTAGLVMLMLQSALAALAIYTPGASPAEILKATNRLLVENVRRRMGGDDHATLVLMHVTHDGDFVFAGGHEPMVVLRAASTKCEVVDAVGPWLGISDNIEKNFQEGRGKLDPGDSLVFHSDGTVDAGASQRNAYGLDRLCAAVERLRHQPAQVMCGEILRECRGWAPGPQQDDMSIVVVRRL